MNQENNKLLKKSLLMLLAHSDGVRLSDGDVEVVVDNGVLEKLLFHLSEGHNISWKPLLYKLEDLNDKLKEELRPSMAEENEKLYYEFYGAEVFLMSEGFMEDEICDSYTIDLLPKEVLEWYLKNHADIEFLIDKGLAINKKEI